MNLSESEIEIAEKQIKKWEKFEKQWPWMRWWVLVLSFVLAYAGIFGFQSMERMWDMGEQWPLINNAELQSEIKGYLDMRTSLLRGEFGIYVGAIVQLGISTSIFVSLIFNWNRHKYIRLKTIALKTLLENKSSSNS